MRWRCFRAVMLLAVIMCASLMCGIVDCASVEIWPSERRRNNTLYWFEGDWNWMTIMLYPEDYGEHVIDIPERFEGSSEMYVTLPESVELLGTNKFPRNWGGEEKDFENYEHFRKRDYESEIVVRDGAEYERFRIPLDNDILNWRLIDANHHVRFYVWIHVPEALEDVVMWELYYGGKKLSEGSSRVVTAGRVSSDAVLPERFGFYPYGTHDVVPHDDYGRMAEFYSRFGISGISTAWLRGLPPRSYSSKHMRLMMEANREHGVENIANMQRFAWKHANDMTEAARAPQVDARRELTLERGGLISSMDEIVRSFETEEAVEDWAKAHEIFDSVNYNWEPAGPRIWPGYDDEEAMAFFASEHGIEDPSPGLIESEYREEYERFRMEQISRPVLAMQRTIARAGPMPFRVEQGCGASPHIDYDVYGHDVDLLSPMIYTRRPIRYAQRLKDLVERTPVESKKLWPDTTVGWGSAGPHRETPGEFVLDTVVTAALGCGGISHWPGIWRVDGSWHGIHEGLRRIAPVEDFYLDGEAVAGAKIEGKPFFEERIKVADREIARLYPDWDYWLVSFAHRLGGEYLFTLLNYKAGQDAFAVLEFSGLTSGYLINPFDEAYKVLDGTGSAMVRVPAESPVMWMATTDDDRIAGYRRLDADEIRLEFEAARGEFVDREKAEDIELGRKGDINVEYALAEFGEEERMVLRVETPFQRVAFGSSGGRIYAWEVDGMEGLVANDNFYSEGMGMDLLWLPASARWSGDEINDMDLLTVKNDGTEAEVVYEGEFESGLPGVRVRKSYMVPAEEKSVEVRITLISERVDKVELSYWAHHVFDRPAMYFINEEMTYTEGLDEETVILAEGLDEELKRVVYGGGKVAGETGPVYAEYFPGTHSGLIFRLPDEFMNVYRWSSIRSEHYTSEWMSRPFFLPAGGEAELNYSVTAVPEATIQSLREAVGLKSLEASGDVNLLPYSFEETCEENLPADWEIERRGENPEALKISAERDESGEKAVKVYMPHPATVRISSPRFDIDPEKDYILVVDLQVEDMFYTGAHRWWQSPLSGVIMYVYGRRENFQWLSVSGEGSTGGWVTAISPFPLKEERREYFDRVRVTLGCFNMTGKVSFRNPKIVKLPPRVEREEGTFIMPDGNRVFGHMRLLP